MANEKGKTETSAKPTTPKESESVYTTEFMIDNFAAFNTSREIVEVALKQANIKSATYSEAKTIIERFKNKEVK